MNNLLEIKNLSVSVKEDGKEDGKEDLKEILNNLNLTINKGEVHIIMGTNGCGKSTLANTLMGHPNYIVTKGEAIFQGENILTLTPEQRAKKGLFLAFQYPTAIQGLSVGSFLRAIMKAVNEKDIPIREFRQDLNKAMEELEIPKEFLSRSLNDGFSGGEKKRHEILQMSLLKPKLTILDETDSGLDVDALKLVFENINKRVNSENSFIIITHYNKVLKYVKPDFVHIMKNGKIIKSGGIELSNIIEEKGFDAVINN